MELDRRRLAVALAGLCAFLDLYAPQALLPLFASEFHATATAVSLTVSAATLAVAIVAPFVGAVADVLGRKRIIVSAAFLLVVPTLMLSLSDTLDGLIAWRFVQGLLLPPIFAVTVAYIGDEWPIAQIAAVAGLYTAGAGLGGFLGRFLSGVASHAWGWRAAFLLLAAINLAAGFVIAFFLPRERRFVRAAGLFSSVRAMGMHLRNPGIVAILAVGFTVLFSFIATFTYVSFYLAAPPFGLTPAALGSIFVVYLVGAAASPWAGRAIELFGRRRFMAMLIAAWCGGLILTLVKWLPAVLIGLALATAGGFMCQTASTSLLASTAKTARSSAVGLYVTCYYVGGTCGGIVTGFAWHLGGWPACVALVIAVLLAMATIALAFWREPEPDAPSSGPSPG